MKKSEYKNLVFQQAQTITFLQKKIVQIEEEVKRDKAAVIEAVSAMIGKDDEKRN